MSSPSHSLLDDLWAGIEHEANAGGAEADLPQTSATSAGSSSSSGNNGTMHIPFRLLRLGRSDDIAVLPCAEDEHESDANDNTGTIPSTSLPCACVSNTPLLRPSALSHTAAAAHADPVTYAFDHFINMLDANACIACSNSDNVGGMSSSGGSGSGLHSSGAVALSESLYSAQEVWDDVDSSGASMTRSDRLYVHDIPTAPRLTTIQLQRDHRGRITGVVEREKNHGKQSGSIAWWRGNVSMIVSSSLGGSVGSGESGINRPMASRAIGSKGSNTFVPFRPGGIDTDTDEDIDLTSAYDDDEHDGDETVKDEAEEQQRLASTASGATARSLSEVTVQSLFPWDSAVPSQDPPSDPSAASASAAAALFPDLAAAGEVMRVMMRPPTGVDRGLLSIDDMKQIQDAAAATAAVAEAESEAETMQQPSRIPSADLIVAKAQDAAAHVLHSSAGVKVPTRHTATDATPTANPYIAGVNTSTALADVELELSSEESYNEYRRRARELASHQALKRTEKLRQITEEMDEALFEEEEEDEKKSHAEEERKEKADEAVEDEDDLLAEFDLNLSSAAGLKAEAELARRTRAATHLWATTDRLDVSTFHQQLPNLAIRYPFELDTFQKEAILHLERGESVFVAAHTSAGKTVVAEYAIALAAKHLTRAVYTSPIKTLSNQKFREFTSVFGERDVGIMTGDVSINTDASCLILTTEILRSMLYKGADLIRDIEWVIFDECHYVNDLERGVVWEEVIIMLPPHVNIVLLSATVPNTLEFADWVGRTKKRQVYVIATDKRPVPLQHFLWLKGKLFPILDGSTGRFNPDGFKAARNEGMTEKVKAQQRRGIFKKPSLRQAKNSWIQLVKYLQQHQLLPVVIFAFSKKIVEESAYGMYNLDLTTSSEKSEISALITNVLVRLQPVDRRLPQVMRVRELMKRGIGCHHAGMLPILKELVEMAFSRGLVKVLFATETFAMGVNMPTKTVVFYSLRKHDGTNFRDLLPGEYTQMSGRAGRRGLDRFGIVIINTKNDEVPDERAVKHILTGKSTRLESRFRLTYNMILNLMRQEDMRVEEMIKRSFGELHTARDTPRRKLLLAKGEKKLRHMRPVACTGDGQCSHEQMEEYFSLTHQIQQMQIHLFESVFQPGSALSSKYLSIGRVLILNIRGLDNCAAVVLRNQPAAVGLVSNRNDLSKKTYVAFILVPPLQALSPHYVAECAKLDIVYGSTMTAPKLHYLISEFGPSNVVAIVNQRLDVDASAILVDRFQRKMDALAQDLLTKVQEQHGVSIPKSDVAAAAADGQSAMSSGMSKKQARPSLPKHLVPSRLPSNLLMDPLTDLKLNAMSSASDDGTNFGIVDEQYMKVQLQKQLELSPVNHCNQCTEHYAELSRQHELRAKVTTLRRLLSDENLDLLSDFEHRLGVLQSLHYVDAQDRTVQLKGRVACEINTCDSLIVTELIFENVLTSLEAEEIVSLLSCLIFQEKNADPPELTDRLLSAKQRLEHVTLRLGELQLRCGLDIVPADFVKQSVRPGLMQVVYEWAKGTPFSAICLFTNVLEGSIVRCITRLDETCRDLRNAARVIGDAPLYSKMVRASELIRRDIIFAPSLYVT